MGPGAVKPGGECGTNTRQMTRKFCASPIQVAAPALHMNAAPRIMFVFDPACGVSARRRRRSSPASGFVTQIPLPVSFSPSSLTRTANTPETTEGIRDFHFRIDDRVFETQPP